jgi:hypothetical protein
VSKKYTEKELGLAIAEEYDTGYHNGWTMATEKVESILLGFEERKDTWTWQEVYAAIAKAKQDELKVLDESVRAWVGSRDTTKLVPIKGEQK